MEALLFLSIIAIASIFAVRASRQHKASVQRSHELKQLASAKHAVSGRFPTTCSWCRETVLAKHVFLLERDGAAWRAIDIGDRIGGLAPEPAAVEARRLLVEASPQIRRLCSEKCVRDLLSADGGSAQTIGFAKCEYCGSSVVATTTTCQHCGARRAA